MGSFEGHALPGTFFFLFGLCHTVAIYRRYFRALYSQQSPGYHSKVMYIHDVRGGAEKG